MTMTRQELDRCYRALDLEPGASLVEVKRAWRDLTKVWHPDRFQDDPELRQRAEDRLKGINQAYRQVLAALRAQEGTGEARPGQPVPRPASGAPPSPRPNPARPPRPQPSTASRRTDFGVRPKSVPSRRVQAAAVSLLALVVLLAGATYWWRSQNVANAPTKQARPEPQELLVALTQQNSELRDKAVDLQGQLHEALDEIHQLQEKLTQRERREAPSLSELPTSAPEVSAANRQPEARTGMDREEDKAAFLVPGFERIARGVGSLSALEDQYQQACTGTMPVSATDRFGNQVGGSIDRADTPECIARASAKTELRAQIKSEATRIEEAARRAGILPGVLRGLVARYHLGDYLNP